MSRSIISTGKKVILAILLVFGLSGYSQRYAASLYSISDGLANSYVMDVLQDTSSLMWFATMSGVTSYDGLNFINYSLADGLDNSGYKRLKLDSKGGLWALPINCETPISLYDGKKWNKFTNSGIENIHDNSMCFDVAYINDKLVIVVATAANGILLFKDNKWKRLSSIDGVNNVHFSCIIIKGFEVFAATDKGLLKFSLVGDPNIIKVPSILPSKVVRAITFDQNNKLWVLGENWLGYIQGETFSLVSNKLTLNGASSSGFCFIYAVSNNEVYAGNLVNIYCYSQKYLSLELFSRNNGLITDGATAVFCDREKNLWFTSSRGVSKIPSKGFCSFSKTDGLYENEVASLVESSPGHFVLGHHGAITYYDGKKFDYQLLDKNTNISWHEKRVIDLVKDKNGDIWAAITSLGVARINKKREIKWYREAQGINGRAFSIAITSDNRLLCSTQQGIFEKIGEYFVPIDLNKEIHFMSRKIFPGKGSEFYLGTLENGLIEIKGKTLTYIKAENNNKANNVYSVLVDSRNNTWVGTLDGLYERKGNTLKKVNNNGLSIDNPVFLIIEDKENRLWFGTDNGLYRWNNNKLLHFTPRNGLGGQEVNRSAGVIDEKDYLWVGTNNGISLYRPEYDVTLNNIVPPKVRIISVEADNEFFNANERIKLSSSHNELIFHFRSLSYIDEKQQYYKYKLQGLDDDWSSETNLLSDHIRFSNLSPGKYKIFITVRNPYGVWSEAVSSSWVIIDKPFYNKWWFIILVIILILGGLYFAGRFIFITRTKKNLERLVDYRTRKLSISEERLRNINSAKDTFFTVISHDLRSPYNSLLGMLDLLISEYSILSEEEKISMLTSVKATADRSYNLLENLLTWARAQKGLIPYEPELFLISEVIEENIHLFESNLNKKGIFIDNKSVKEVMVFADRNMITTVIRNLLSNAIKYTYAGGRIDIYTTENGPDSIIVSIQDNGAGISPAVKESLFRIDSRISTKGTSNETGTGMGLILCKEFIEQNNGMIWVTSEEGKGSTFSFIVNLNRPE